MTDKMNEYADVCAERDALKAEVVALNESRRSNLQAVDHLTAELAKVKGELKELETEYSDREMVSDGEICCLGIDRDHWRGIAEKVKGELEKVSKFGADEMLRRGDAMAKQLFLIQDRDRWRGIAEGAREALIAQIKMRDAKNPQKIDEALAWKDNDDLADRLTESALAAFPPPGPKEPS